MRGDAPHIQIEPPSHILGPFNDASCTANIRLDRAIKHRQVCFVLLASAGDLTDNRMPLVPRDGDRIWPMTSDRPPMMAGPLSKPTLLVTRVQPISSRE